MASSASKFVLMFLILSVAVLPSTLATDYVVCDNLGWNLGVDILAWLNLKTFHVQDTFHFYFTSPHTVALVDEAAYLTCDCSHPIINDVSGNFSFTFTKSGTYWFTSSAAGDCAASLKMQVTVL
ncbi:UNVERIFIED_CONTAM: hypothetical protein Slati_2462900 [Sesamum latifolium]|uniref:Phytocyanin domain-containing protein n=1 Tax=Sesamum latifolium TaxID=2727402 RepID=A0AAW2WEK9_9LAMI